MAKGIRISSPFTSRNPLLAFIALGLIFILPLLLGISVSADYPRESSFKVFGHPESSFKVLKPDSSVSSFSVNGPTSSSGNLIQPKLIPDYSKVQDLSSFSNTSNQVVPSTLRSSSYSYVDYGEEQYQDYPEEQQMEEQYREEQRYEEYRQEQMEEQRREEEQRRQELEEQQREEQYRAEQQREEQMEEQRKEEEYRQEMEDNYYQQEMDDEYYQQQMEDAYYERQVEKHMFINSYIGWIFSAIVLYGLYKLIS